MEQCHDRGRQPARRGTILGTSIVAEAATDGYTLGYCGTSFFATATRIRNIPYNALTDFVAVTAIAKSRVVLVVHPSLPVSNLAELIAHAKAAPGKVNYASVGIGSVHHLCGELFNLMTRASIVHVPYKGGGPALAAVAAGEAHVTSVSAVPTLPHLRAGRLKALAITTTKRSPMLPDVPTTAETVPGDVVSHWYGIWGPKGITRDIVLRWNREVAKVVQGAAINKQMQGEGLELAAGPPEQFQALIRDDVTKWRRVISEAKIERVK